MQVPTSHVNLFNAIVKYIDAAIATGDFDTMFAAYNSEELSDAISTLYWVEMSYRYDIADAQRRLADAIRTASVQKYGKIEHHVVDGEATADDVLRGTVLSCSWGYDQTNVDYYVVVKRTPKTVTYIPMTMTETADSMMTGTALPGVVQFEKAPIRRSIRETSYGVRINGEESYQSCYVWNGRAKYVSHYH